MKVYAAVRRGVKGEDELCDDRVLVQDTIIEQGYHEFDLSDSQVVLAVADGVGGNAGGFKAATIALEGIKTSVLMETRFAEGEDAMLAQIVKTSDVIYAQGKESDQFKEMASTLSALSIGEENMELYHLGDSRIYQMRNSHGMEVFEQHTKDHNLLYLWRRNKDVHLNDYDSLEQLKLCHPEWSTLVSWMGLPSEEVYKRIQLKKGLHKAGMLMLTSDGIHDYVDETELIGILEQDGLIADKIELLMQRARENGSVDDQSIIIAQFELEE